MFSLSSGSKIALFLSMGEGIDTFYLSESVGSVPPTLSYVLIYYSITVVFIMIGCCYNVGKY